MDAPIINNVFSRARPLSLPCGVPENAHDLLQ
jgi:hypothetical protein